jgi:flagellar basal body rod protein FlgG
VARDIALTVIAMIEFVNAHNLEQFGANVYQEPKTNQPTGSTRPPTAEDPSSFLWAKG